jgi:hypothetical protein
MTEPRKVIDQLGAALAGGTGERSREEGAQLARAGHAPGRPPGSRSGSSDSRGRAVGPAAGGGA